MLILNIQQFQCLPRVIAQFVPAMIEANGFIDQSIYLGKRERESPLGS